ncbi:MAG: hypothetical protein LIO87_02645 [Eubacterium sp.]|nr:hypothetical protein [Eubacterium sp.]
MKVTSSTDFIKYDFGEVEQGECFCIGEISADNAYMCMAEAENSDFNAVHLQTGTQLNIDYEQPVILLKAAEVLLFGRKQGDKNVSQV